MISRFVLGGLLALVLLWRMLHTYGGGGYWNRHGPIPNVAPLFAGSATTPLQRQLGDSLTIAVARNAGAAEGAFTADVTITNRSATAVKDVGVDCDGIGESGVTIGRMRFTISGGVRARGTTTMENVRLPFVQRNVASARCTVVDFALAQ